MGTNTNFGYWHRRRLYVSGTGEEGVETSMESSGWGVPGCPPSQPTRGSGEHRELQYHEVGKFFKFFDILSPSERI